MTLSLRHLSYSISQKTLLSDVSIDLSPGALYGLVGPNGAGKTTLLKAIAGITPLTTGEATWCGRPLLSLSRQELCRLVSYVPQNPPLNFDFTVRELVSMGRYAHNRRYHHSPDHAVADALAAVDLTGCGDRAVSVLSSGERQRAYLARALVGNAPILLLDEPTASLDIRHQLEMWELLRHLAASGHLLLVAHHDLATAAQRCDALVVMQQGRCLAHGPTAATLSAPLIAEVFGVALQPGITPTYHLLNVTADHAAADADTPVPADSSAAIPP